jgi:hypothetical protein
MSLPRTFHEIHVENVHPASFLRNKNKRREERQEVWRKLQQNEDPTTKINLTSTKTTDPIAPWDYDIYKRKLICFSACNQQHFGLFVALNTSKLVYGDKTKKLECALASLDSMTGTASPLPRKTRWVDFIYFLLNVCKDIHTWVGEQDEDDVKSLEEPDLAIIFNSCMEETKSERGGFFKRSNMWPERLPSAKQQRNGYDNCGVFTSLNWSMFGKIKPDQPSLWGSINSLDDLDTRIGRSF